MLGLEAVIPFLQSVPYSLCEPKITVPQWSSQRVGGRDRGVRQFLAASCYQVALAVLVWFQLGRAVDRDWVWRCGRLSGWRDGVTEAIWEQQVRWGWRDAWGGMKGLMGMEGEMEDGGGWKKWE